MINAVYQARVTKEMFSIAWEMREATTEAAIHLCVFKMLCWQYASKAFQN